MSPLLRPATLGDAATLDQIFRTSFCDTFAHLYRRADLDLFMASFGIGDWQAEIADPGYGFCIAEADGFPAAFVKLGPLKLPIETKRSAIMVYQLYVLKAYQGAGVARPLMDWAIEEAKRRDAEEMFLTVFVDNHRARRFYERYSFEAVGRYDFIVGNQADHDIVLRKVL